MENLIIVKQNLLTFGLTRNKLICDCCKRSAEAERNREISDERPKTESSVVSIVFI